VKKAFERSIIVVEDTVDGTCALDGVLPHSPAEYVRRPAVSVESPTLGFTHLQFEALLTAARQSAHPCEFALVAMLGLLGLRIFEATGADIADLDSRGARMDRHAATRRLRRLAEAAGVRITRPHPHMLRHTLSRPCWMLAWTCGTSRSPPGTLIRGPRCGRAGS